MHQLRAPVRVHVSYSRANVACWRFVRESLRLHDPERAPGVRPRSRLRLHFTLRLGIGRLLGGGGKPSRSRRVASSAGERPLTRGKGLGLTMTSLAQRRSTVHAPPADEDECDDAGGRRELKATAQLVDALIAAG